MNVAVPAGWRVLLLHSLHKFDSICVCKQAPLMPQTTSCCRAALLFISLLLLFLSSNTHLVVCFVLVGALLHLNQLSCHIMPEL